MNSLRDNRRHNM